MCFMRESIISFCKGPTIDEGLKKTQSSNSNMKGWIKKKGKNKNRKRNLSLKVEEPKDPPPPPTSLL